ncbi:XdhC family protein [Streptomyces sp. NPDC005146]
MLIFDAVDFAAALSQAGHPQLLRHGLRRPPVSSPTTPRSASPCCAGRLASPVAYMGAMGSCHTHQQRLQLLREAGVSELHLTRLRSPVDLDLRAHTVIAHTHQRPNTPLPRSTGLIHRQKTPA